MDIAYRPWPLGLGNKTEGDLYPFEYGQCIIICDARVEIIVQAVGDNRGSRSQKFFLYRQISEDKLHHIAVQRSWQPLPARLIRCAACGDLSAWNGNRDILLNARVGTSKTWFWRLAE